MRSFQHTISQLREFTRSYGALLYFLIWQIGVIKNLARWRLKSPASRLFAQSFVQAQINENIKSFASLAFVRGIHPSQRASNAEIVSYDDVTMTDSNVTACHINHVGQQTLHVLEIRKPKSPKLPRIFSGAPLTFNGAHENIPGNPCQVRKTFERGSSLISLPVTVSKYLLSVQIYTEALKGHRVVWKIEIYYLIRMTYEWKSMSSGWHNNIVVTHPDEIPISAKSSGWHMVVWYVIRMTYCSVQKSSGWDTARS